jgi:putative phosphoesterase
MRVGVMADSHDRVPAIAELLRRMAAGGVGLVLHAGDYCSPFALEPFRALNMALAGVFGNNDGDREGIKSFAAMGVGGELYESPHSVELDGKRVLIVHELSEATVRSVEHHALVVHGYTHRREMRKRGDALILNPGEACGWIHGTPTAAIVDLDSLAIEFLELTGPEWEEGRTPASTAAGAKGGKGDAR